MTTRRHFNASLIAAGAALASPLVRANDDAAIHVLVGFPAGGGSDVIARLLAEKLQAELGRSVVVDNRPGAGGQIAAQQLKAARPDGTTVFLSHDHTISILPQVVRKPGYAPTEDFVALGGFATFVNGLAVSAATPANTLSEYVEWVRSRQGGKSAIGIPAPASTPEFLVQLIGRKYGLALTAVPYKGSAPMIADMLGNQIAAGTGSVQDFIEYQRAGKLRVIGVLGGKRQAALPDVPTFSEMGFGGLEDTPFYGLWAPRGTPAAFIDRFTRALDKVVALPEVRARLTDLGLTVGYMTPQQLDQRERAYTKVWSRIIADSGFQPQ
ncbi:MAG TPA: Bug family tripartite tricarboxylate transporter substrate binding protein [Ottowia sp.]|mgnify:FL=1|nr:Bug family tripartite tricarboxylate transporter substrate binding protein [Ottowia sp.]HNJ45988.1 Bug family tripartite tricarboxylate transporter substrate binding protein [Ottowia sp.]HNK52911.1 Bug family tripartite tricarboxylate transporter substrate binding protein [Ottowia sp.]HNT86215.1 Bug family tripartite tricarboxylate transporter substrate binding protein [Ottowia sp.]HQO53015.1 Bug family tripartite tricarboxylate transporter substrate binding protein [Ottowia sp.]